MTEREALTEIKELIDKYWGTDPIYYTDSLNPHETEVAKLCCKINEIINNVTETNQPETKTKEKPKKKVYAISYEQFFFGNHYDRYAQFIETEDIFHEVGVLIYKASTAVRNIRWCELRDESVKAAIARYMSEYSEDWKRIDRTDILRFIGKK